MNICFIANFSKTQVFDKIAQLIIKKGHRVSWITSNRQLNHQLVASYGQENVLLVNKQAIEKTAAPIAEFKLNEIVYGDRFLRHTPADSIRFLTNIQQPILQFLRSHSSRFILGEVTWAHEILIHRICQTNLIDCTFLNPHVVRIPNGRFGFFADEQQSEFYSPPGRAMNQWEILRPKAPDYLTINRKIQSKNNSFLGMFNRVKKFIQNRDPDALDPSLQIDFKHSIQSAGLAEWRQLNYRKLVSRAPSDLPTGPYAYLGLHKQPEASIDVLGRYYEDQLQNILNLWRALPTGWTLIIKEHSIAIGDRSMAFYKKIKSLPNVQLLNENTSSHALIKHAQLIVTVSGTMAYEAALMDIPAITFAPTFFNKLNYCRQISLDELKIYSLKDFSVQLKNKKNNIEEFSKFLFANTFAGNTLDPISDPTVLAEENIQKLTSALLLCINQEVLVH